jgi:hypothetical protein
MAPEQVRADAVVDRRADVYAMTATLNYLLTSRPHHRGWLGGLWTAWAMIGQPLALRATVARGLSPWPCLRHSTTAELGEAIGRFAEPCSPHRRSSLAEQFAQACKWIECSFARLRRACLCFHVEG